MKKPVLLTSAALITTGLLLAGCSDQSKDTNAQPTQQSQNENANQVALENAAASDDAVISANPVAQSAANAPATNPCSTNGCCGASTKSCCGAATQGGCCGAAQGGCCGANTSSNANPTAAPTGTKNTSCNPCAASGGTSSGGCNPCGTGCGACAPCNPAS